MTIIVDNTNPDQINELQSKGNRMRKWRKEKLLFLIFYKQQK
jgi:hypothetical protein